MRKRILFVPETKNHGRGYDYLNTPEEMRGGVASFWEKFGGGSPPRLEHMRDLWTRSTRTRLLSRNTLTTGSAGVMGTRGGAGPACFLVTSLLAR